MEIKNIEGRKLKCVNTFKYLGTLVMDDGNVRGELKMRRIKVIQQLKTLKSIMLTSNIHWKLKVKLNEALLNSIMLYNCEVWNINAKQIENLNQSIAKEDTENNDKN